MNVLLYLVMTLLQMITMRTLPIPLSTASFDPTIRGVAPLSTVVINIQLPIFQVLENMLIDFALLVEYMVTM